METALHTAQIIVAKTHEQGEAITQLKLQKLLYYVQGWSKALLREWRFDDSIEAWDYGPVVYAVRQEFGRFGRGPITLDRELFPADDLVVDTVLAVYGQHRAEALMALTHKDMPWQKKLCPHVRAGRDSERGYRGFFCGRRSFAHQDPRPIF